MAENWPGETVRIEYDVGNNPALGPREIFRRPLSAADTFLSDPEKEI